MEQHSNTPSARPSSVQRQIDENLRRVYDEALNEDLPDRFRDLLAQLRAGEGAGDGERAHDT